MSKAMTMSIIFRANSLNYGEGIGNISELKKFHRADGNVYTFASRQSIRYDIVRLGNEWFGWNLDTVDKTKGTLQFKENTSINDSVEMDLFGYLKTAKQSKKRPAVARLSHAVSMEPYRSDMEFLNNMGMAERIGETPNLANIEQHESLYAYTITIDMNRVGKDLDIELSPEEKTKRMHEFLDVIKLLNRNIRGRQESLAPLFVIGGVYDVANPFFLGRLMLNHDMKNWLIETDILKDTLDTTFGGSSIKDQTRIGYIKGVFENDGEIGSLCEAGNVESFFGHLKQGVSAYYADAGQ
ncbi:type I-B CRISPR-associated protein Cas7/Cst2/DevR [Domibacillus indicus]|uniref:type I-B CRISPR-associated protein Cas7/Cst2/DevR n=1 Tax=Domibacillus indicus TaxID=1437523 RepID=UPI000617C80C|nr:type I-B CRISPR-associated protein Cas7/Cst2/DevR [Domibacillus indicus]